MEEIKVMFKPEWVSWEDIHKVLVKANEVNVRMGFNMGDLNMPPEQLQHQTDNGGTYVVAMHGDKLVGVTACKFSVGDLWFNKGKRVARRVLTGIIKSYQGCGILKEMDQMLDAFISDSCCDIMEASTAEKNMVVRKKAAMGGYKEVLYNSYRNRDYYSVEFAKWLSPCPYPNWYIRFRCVLSKFYIKTRYKVGRVERFRVLSGIWKAVKKVFK